MIKKRLLIFALFFGFACAMELPDVKTSEKNDNCLDLASLENRISLLKEISISKATKGEIVIDASNAFIAIKLGDPRLSTAIKLLLKAFSLETQ